MIYIFDAANRDSHGGYLLDMHEVRHDIFVKTRGWYQLDNVFGLECDEYDSRLATYLLCVDDGRVIGGVRLMPTTFGTFLGEQYIHLLDDPEYEFGAEVWEMYRLFVTDSKWRSETGHDARREIILMMMEFLYSKGAKKIVAVTDSAMTDKLLPWWTWREIGERSTFEQAGAGDGECALVEIELDAEVLRNNRQFLKFHDDCIMRAEEGLPPKTTNVKPEDMYLLNRWLAAHPEEIRLARDLVSGADTDEGAKAYRAYVNKVVGACFTGLPEKPALLPGKAH